MKINIGLSDQDRNGVIDILNVLVADEYVLYTMTRNYHWNVIGPQFHDLHKFFEAQYEELNDVVDDVAERARSLGGTAMGSLSEFLKRTRLKEPLGASASDLEMVKTL
jgi:starvation-inducible DNA-binding protein